MRLLSILAVIAVLTGCTSQTQPTPTATPTSTASPPATGQPTASSQPTTTATTTPTTGPTATAPASPANGAGGETIVLEPFADGFDSPVLITHAGDGSGRLYVVEQAGVIRLLDGEGNAQAEPFLDIVDRIASGGERGLLGLAFHPSYAENGRFFVNYTDTDGDTVVAEFGRISDTAADPNSERVLFTVDQPFANHNGGHVAFGPDGALYIGMGDGGSGGDPQGNGQNPQALLGKMLRLDVDTADPSPEIWASGLRNPWRFSFDSQTGDMFIGDVGQGRWEEIDAQPAGAGPGQNYGWNITEGPDCFGTSNCDMSGLTAPVAWYPHSGGDCSVTGGYVYRGAAYPTLTGLYLYGDYCSGIIRGFDASAAIGGGDVRVRKKGEAGFNISSFGVDESNELFIVDHGGSILRVTDAPASPP